MSPHELSERLLDFGARVCKVVDALPDTRAGRHVANQLIRCGTSPAPNYEEACAAESRADFTHKMSLCLKELRESRMWLRFIIKAELLSAKRIQSLWQEADELCNIFGQSVVTSKKTRAEFPKTETLKRRSSNLQFAMANFQFSIGFANCIGASPH